ncbi:RagB/SusD family nutrient uptake outer membrane protein [Sphingobacterium bambusae]|uniref:RagB/SusD family nutrient uptake outer membrane protein n=1 Tax=Sphingobacterium bambusae TaxID=662858 RepID=A0ABW6BDC4_9SPHI|nr:RagB/SusD family nutrient uptake outer membrane protein [Sphingobacterium bambusae]WPL49213.1 RagB/SusD family nutrient uptake outer membrane protein [Sphingobacterium bambusae]
MKNFSKILLIGLLTSSMLSGCKKDFLERLPQGRLTEDDLTSGALESKVFAIYSGLRSEALSGLPYLAVHNIRADDADKGSAPSDGVDAENIFDNFQYNTNFWLINTYWSGHYTFINLANIVIDEGAAIESPNEATLINIGEAKFFRAFAYFNLVRAFGEVPLIDHAIVNASDAIKPKSTIAEIYNLIDQDLQDATAALPSEKDWGGRFPGRIAKGAAFALQAKTFAARKNWSAMLTASENVMSLNQYDLSLPFDQIFRESNENGKESVFEIQAFYDQSTTNLGITYASRQGVRGSGEWNLGWGWNVPNEVLATAFEVGDPRKDATLLYTGRTNTPYNEVVPSGLPRPYWNKKAYTNPAIRNSAGDRQGGWFNFRVIRYSDVVLMAAEAANETGQAEKAVGYLEQVRSRARGAADVLPKVESTNQSTLRTAIRHERQVELGMENERFFDLIRWEIDVETLHNVGKTGYQLRHRYLPIPQTEIDKSGGVLVQNPNY